MPKKVTQYRNFTWVIVIITEQTSIEIRRLNGIQNHQKEEILMQCIIWLYCHNHDKKKAFELFLKTAEGGHRCIIETIAFEFT